MPRTSRILAIHVVPILILSFTLFGQAVPSERVIWEQDFEEPNSFWENWHVEGGAWQVGEPTSGPAGAFRGANSAATVLGGDVPGTLLTARLVRHEPFLVPGTDQYPRLRFWHWFDLNGRIEPLFYARDGKLFEIGDIIQASATVEARRPGEAWSSLARPFTGESSLWSRPSIDLSPFAGSRIEIAFAVALDLSEIEVFARTDPGNLTRFRNFDDRNVSRPLFFKVTGSSSGAIWGSRIYTDDSTLATAAVHAGILKEGETGVVQVMILPGQSRYVGSVRNGVSSASYGAYVGSYQVLPVPESVDRTTLETMVPGWYLDAVEALVGDQNLPDPETFESGLGDWSVDNGNWEVGATNPSLDGHRSGQVAGTVLGGPYAIGTSSRLVSPLFKVPSADLNPRLSFWQWFGFAAGDSGEVQVRSRGGEWLSIASKVAKESAVWSRRTIPLVDWGGQEIQLGFLLKSESAANSGAGAQGWRIDDVAIEIGEESLQFPEGFENGLGDWYVTAGIWEVGEPGLSAGAHQGERSAGTVLQTFYPAGVLSDLVSPPFRIPDASQNPRLTFWSWHSFASNTSDGQVFLQLEDGSIERLPGEFSGSSRTWTRTTVDFAPFVQRRARLIFRHRSGASDTSDGWFVDDINIETGRAGSSNPEGFETGLCDWAVTGGNWETGVPGGGPKEAYVGQNVAATLLQGQYSENASSSLISPEFIVPSRSLSPRLRFWHWHDFGSGDSGHVELIRSGNSLVVVAGPFQGNSLQSWSNGYADLSPYAGEKVRVAFRLDSDDSSGGWGWALDEVRLQTSALGDIADLGGDVPISEGDVVTFLVDHPPGDFEFEVLPLAGESHPTIDRKLGVFTWAIDEADGPGVHQFRVALIDPQSAWNPIDFEDFSIDVQEINQPPTFGTVPGRVRTPDSGALLVDLPISDPDLPPQNLTLSLDGGPLGAVIDSGSFGHRIVWLPTADQASQAQLFRIRVTDDGDPPMSTTMSVTAIPGGLTVQQVALEDGEVLIRYDGIEPGVEHILYQAGSLSPAPVEWVEAQRLTWETPPFELRLTPDPATPAAYFWLQKR